MSQYLGKAYMKENDEEKEKKKKKKKKTEEQEERRNTGRINVRIIYTFSHLGAWGYNWATQSPGDINMETWSSRLGVGAQGYQPCLYKKIKRYRNLSN
jgi:hypothetical protein